MVTLPPFERGPTAVIVSVSFSTSVSPSSTSRALPLLSSSTVNASASATGSSLTAVTVMLKFCGALVSLPPLAVPPLSISTRLRLAVPKALSAGV